MTCQFFRYCDVIRPGHSNAQSNRVRALHHRLSYMTMKAAPCVLLSGSPSAGQIAQPSLGPREAQLRITCVQGSKRCSQRLHGRHFGRVFRDLLGWQLATKLPPSAKNACDPYLMPPRSPAPDSDPLTHDTLLPKASHPRIAVRRSSDLAAPYEERDCVIMSQTAGRLRSGCLCRNVCSVRLSSGTFRSAITSSANRERCMTMSLLCLLSSAGQSDRRDQVAAPAGISF
jgi:hypothetical protein